jgi:RNA polymerase sigma-70 factor (ECF subfamily)
MIAAPITLEASTEATLEALTRHIALLWRALRVLPWSVMAKPLTDPRKTSEGGAQVVPFPGAGPSDAQLVEAARERQSWALEALFRRHARFVNGLAFRLMPRDGELDDLVQDSFVEAFANLERLADPGAFKGWLGSIVVRTAHKRIRRRRLMERVGLRRREPIDLDAVVPSTSSPEAALELRRVYAVLESMGAEERIALVLRRVEGLELTEIAERMSLSLATVKRRLVAAEAILAASRDAEGGAR